MYELNAFSSTAELDREFALQVAELLRQGIAEKGQASIAVSGGNTPKPFFEQLSLQPLDWSKVVITLVDDRWLPADHADSNQNLVKASLLINKAAAATFVPITNTALSPYGQEQAIAAQMQLLQFPLDVVILGMGNDGHTASLFPCCEQLQAAMQRDSDELVFATTPTTAPYDRMTFSLATLLGAKNIFLHIVGEAKKVVFDQAVAAISDETDMPIRAFLGDPQVRVNVMWAE